MIFWIDLARVIAAFGVVFLHVSALSLAQQSFGSASWWVGNIFDSFGRWCVPVFVMISGALLLNPQKEEETVAFYKKRSLKIVPPILFWSAAGLFTTFIRSKDSLNGDTIKYLLSKFLTGYPYYHLWFLFMIGGLYLIAPFLKKAIKHSNPQEQLILLSVTSVLCLANPILAKIAHVAVSEMPFTNLFIGYIPYFLLGYYLSVCSIRRGGLFWSLLFAATILCIALGCYIVKRMQHDTGSVESYFYTPFNPFVFFASICAFMLLKKAPSSDRMSGLIRNFSQATLGIYLFHPFLLGLFGYRLENREITANQFYILPVSIGAFAASYLLTRLMKRIPLLRRCV